MSSDISTDLDESEPFVGTSVGSCMYPCSIHHHCKRFGKGSDGGPIIASKPSSFSLGRRRVTGWSYSFRLINHSWLGVRFSCFFPLCCLPVFLIPSRYPFKFSFSSVFSFEVHWTPLTQSASKFSSKCAE